MNKECKAKLGSFETMYDGLVFKIKQRDVVYPNGNKERHEYCQRFDSATILPFDKHGNLLLTKEYRIANDAYIWFLPTGKIEEGEDAIQGAQRELREETGFRANNLKLLFDSPASSSYFLWNVYVFVAKDLVKDPLPAEEQCPIEVVPTPMKEAVKMAMDGTIKNQFLAYYIIRFNYMLESNQFCW